MQVCFPPSSEHESRHEVKVVYKCRVSKLIFSANITMCDLYNWQLIIICLPLWWSAIQQLDAINTHQTTNVFAITHTHTSFLWTSNKSINEVVVDRDWSHLSNGGMQLHTRCGWMSVMIGDTWNAIAHSAYTHVGATNNSLLKTQRTHIQLIYGYTCYIHFRQHIDNEHTQHTYVYWWSHRTRGSWAAADNTRVDRHTREL